MTIKKFDHENYSLFKKFKSEEKTIEICKNDVIKGLHYFMDKNQLQ